MNEDQTATLPLDVEERAAESTEGLVSEVDGLSGGGISTVGAGNGTDGGGDGLVAQVLVLGSK